MFTFRAKNFRFQCALMAVGFQVPSEGRVTHPSLCKKQARSLWNKIFYKTAIPFTFPVCGNVSCYGTQTTWHMNFDENLVDRRER